MNIRPENRTDNGDTYRVEVSGWDAAEKFFVEKTVLRWSVDETKEIVLRSPVREGGILFVRLLQPLSNVASSSVPYRAASVTTDSYGRVLVHLTRLHPRPPLNKETFTSGNPGKKIA